MASSESKETSIAGVTDADSKPEETMGEEAVTSTTAHEDATVKDADPPEEEMEYPHGIKLVIILAALCLSVFLVALDQTIISTAIPKITDQFNSIKDIGWYGSSYLLTTTAMQPTFGRIYTVFSVSQNRSGDETWELTSTTD
jgi:hypothetical protein